MVLNIANAQPRKPLYIIMLTAASAEVKLRGWGGMGRRSTSSMVEARWESRSETQEANVSGEVAFHNSMSE